MKTIISQANLENGLNLYEATNGEVKKFIEEQLSRYGYHICQNESEVEDLLTNEEGETPYVYSEAAQELTLDISNSDETGYFFNIRITAYYADAGSDDYYYIVEVW